MGNFALFWLYCKFMGNQWSRKGVVVMYVDTHVCSFMALSTMSCWERAQDQDKSILGEWYHQGILKTRPV